MTHNNRFLNGEARFADWAENGMQGHPPERPLHIGTFAGAALDPFSKFELGAVVYSRHEPEGPDAAVHLWELPNKQIAELDQVKLMVARRILHVARAENPGTEGRVVERVDGFAVPEAPHYVLGFVATRGAEDVALPQDTDQRALELNRRWELLAPAVARAYELPSVR